MSGCVGDTRASRADGSRISSTVLVVGWDILDRAIEITEAERSDSISEAGIDHVSVAVVGLLNSAQSDAEQFIWKRVDDLRSLGRYWH